MTPERLAELETKAKHPEWRFAAPKATILDLIAHIRDLEAPPTCARGCDRDGVGSPCIHELSPDELTGVASHIRDLEAQVREVPSIDDCLYHRCVEHWTVPGRNTTASSNGAECGACIERDWRSAFENYATHHGWCASGHGGMHVLGSPGSCDCGRDARLATATPPSPEVGA